MKFTCNNYLFYCTFCSNCSINVLFYFLSRFYCRRTVLCTSPKWLFATGISETFSNYWLNRVEISPENNFFLFHIFLILLVNHAIFRITCKRKFPFQSAFITEDNWKTVGFSNSSINWTISGTYHVNLEGEERKRDVFLEGLSVWIVDYG